MELLEGFVAGVEAQIDLSVSNFGVAEQVGLEQRWDGSDPDPEEPPERIYQRLGDQTWDLRGIFVDHFPNLQRRSALVTLVSFLESEVANLCDLLRDERRLRLRPSDLRGRGVIQSTLYLSHVVGLRIDRESSEWREVRMIGKLRNLVVHADGQLVGKDKNMKGIREYVEGRPDLAGGETVRILPGYLEHVLEAFDSFFKHVDQAISIRSQ